MEKIGTPFSDIFDLFFTMITDDMFMELDKKETEDMCGDLLIAALPYFEFPRVAMDYQKTAMKTIEHFNLIVDENGDTKADVKKEDVISDGYFINSLSLEEKRILATYMIVQWIGQQLASIELTRMKYTGTDFKMTSQANHIAKLSQLRKEYISEGFHLQRLYSRRKTDNNGMYQPTWSNLRN